MTDLSNEELLDQDQESAHSRHHRKRKRRHRKKLTRKLTIVLLFVLACLVAFAAWQFLVQDHAPRVSQARPITPATVPLTS